MSRNNPRDSIQEVVSRSYKAAGGIESASADLGLCISTLSEHTGLPKGKRAGGLGINYADALSRMHPEVAKVFADHFASHCGSFVQPTDMPKVTNLYAHSMTIARECGEAQAALIKAAASEVRGDLDEAEREMAEGIEALQRGLNALRAKRRGVA